MKAFLIYFSLFISMVWSVGNFVFNVAGLFNLLPIVVIILLLVRFLYRNELA